MKKATFLVGLASGFVLGQNWRSLAKQGVKVGVRASRKLRTLSEQFKDDMEDVGAEAREELSREEEALADNGKAGQ